MRLNIGKLLLKGDMISPKQLQDALNHQKVNGGKISEAFVSLGFVKDEEITKALSRQFGVPWITLHNFEIDPAIIKIIPAETARMYQVLPLSRSNKTLTIAMADPTNVFAIDDIRFMTGFNVEPVVASESELEDEIDRYYGSARSQELRRSSALGGGGYGIPTARGTNESDLADPPLSMDEMAAFGDLSQIDLDSIAEDDEHGRVKAEVEEIDLGNLAKSATAPLVVKLAIVLLVDSLKRGASDIHIEPYEKEFRARFRIDGILYNVMAMPISLRDPLTQRIKVMARLNIAEKRLPQDGRIKLRLRVQDRSRDLDFRVSVRPTLWGETIVLRLLGKSRAILDPTRLGFEWHSLERFKIAVSKTNGMVVVTGPLRSGKTNTLLSAIAALNRSAIHVMTVEDPVDLSLPGVNQVQIDKAMGESAATVLRSLRRLDADVILAGEIDDAEVAGSAMRLAQDGHLVLAALCAGDAPSAVTHLVQAGIDPYLVAMTVNAIVAQRLVRRVCSKCKVDVTAEVPAKTLVDIGFTPDEIGSFQVMKGKGCQTCNDTGYKGQVGLFEVMVMTDRIRDLIMVGATALEIRRKALEEGMLTLRMSGLEKIKCSVTTVEEVLRETVL